jgi:hypothetical protein
VLGEDDRFEAVAQVLEQGDLRGGGWWRDQAWSS